jgi:hypothetical protein
METYKTILEIIAVILLIAGIIFRKKSWGSSLIYFALGMIATFILTDGVDGMINGWKGWPF